MAQATIERIQPTHEACQQTPPLDTADVVRHLAHELRQPLSTIESSAFYLKLVLEGEDGRAARQLDRIEQMVHQIGWILTDAVHYLQAAPPRRQLLDLTETASSVIAALTHEQLVELDWSDREQLPLVLMDPHQAQHMIRSVLQVYRQIARSEVPVTITMRSENGYAMISFRCEAQAALCERCEELLEPFGPHLPTGAGLGLASVQRIAEANGGCVRISAPDEQLQLEILLPSAA